MGLKRSTAVSPPYPWIPPTPTAFKRGDWEAALAHSFLALDRHLAGEDGQRELGQLARTEREKAREQVRDTRGT